MGKSYEQYYENTSKIPFRRKELAGYLFAGIGDSALSGVVNTFFMIFATAILKISPITVGTILLITKFLDAFCDPVVGYLIDNTRTRYGKLRPYILFGGLFWAGLTFLLFIDPGFTSEAMKIAYVATVYTLWGIGFSLLDVPYWSMSATMTTDPQKRNSLVSLTKSATTMGTIIVSLIGGLLISYFSTMPNSGGGYSYLGWLVSLIAAISFIVLFIVSKERVKPSSSKTSLKSMIHILRINKPLQAYIISQLFQVLTMVITMITSFYAIYNLGSIALLSFIMIPTMIGFLLTPVVIPKLLKRVETPTLFLYNGIASLIVGAVYFTVGYSNLIFVFLISILAGFFMSASMTLSTIYVVDSIDYAEWKTGMRAEGIMFAVQSLTAKVMSAFGSFITGLLLTYIGLNTEAVTQSSSTLQGLFFIYAFGVGISSVLGSIPLLICKFKGRERTQILSELEANRAASQ